VTPTMQCSQARVSLGVYVLGAIDPAERALVEAHLATCRDCRDELAGLAALPALLARVTAEEAIALAAGDGPPPAGQARGPDAPPELLATVIDLTAARRRRRRWRDASLGVAAALIVAAGVFGGLRVGGSPAAPPAASVNYPGQPNGPWQTATTSAGGMSASVQYRSMGWGTQLAVKVSGIPIGTSCQLWLIGPGGSRTLAGGWVTDDHEGAVWYPGSAGLPAGGVRGFQVTVGGARTLSLSV
jgi:Putative zinc-finger